MQVVIKVTSWGYSDHVNRHSTFSPDRARAIFDALNSKRFRASSSLERERKKRDNFRAITLSETLSETAFSGHCSERRDCLADGRAKVVPSFLSHFKTHPRPPALQSSALSTELTYTSSLQVNVKW